MDETPYYVGSPELDEDIEPAGESRTGDGRGRFFQIDPRTWAAVCNMQNISAAAAYLVIAQGTVGSSRFSRWSAKSVETYTGLHSSRAKAAISELLSVGILRLDSKSHKRAPRYEVVPFHQCEASCQELLAKRLSEYDRYLVGELSRAPFKPTRKTNKEVLARYRKLVCLGLAKERQDGLFEAPTLNKDAEFIWLPNALVTGAADESSPVRLLRMRNDLIALRLLVDLYKAQNLSADGGISRKVVWQAVKREEITRRGRRIIWGFTPQSSYHSWVPGVTEHLKEVPKQDEGTGVWGVLTALLNLGLIYPVFHLAENETPEAEIVHPYGTTADAEPIEIELGRAARAAAEHLLGPKMGYFAEKYDHLAAVYDTLPNVQMVGIYRLRYRPATQLTGDWYRRLKQGSAAWLEEYAKACGESVIQRKAAAS